VIDCVNAEVRDALPDLLHGRLGELDTATIKAHVESCAACRAELDLMREAIATAPITPPVDAGKIAAAIAPYAAVNTIPAPVKRTGWFGNAPTLRIAVAAAFVAVSGWLLSGRIGNERVPVKQTATTAPAVTADVGESPSSPAPVTTASDAPAASAAQESQVAALSLVGSTVELSDADLEKLVAELDGMETLPSAEPQSITITDEDFATGDENIDR
jgi:predicted anti-sigma-YlaC factor YlaD